MGPEYGVGQWIDVKDTVAQWLEATIMNIDVDRNEIFVHYNGWYGIEYTLFRNLNLSVKNVDIGQLDGTNGYRLEVPGLHHFEVEPYIIQAAVFYHPHQCIP